MTREEAIFKLKDLLIPTTLGSKCIGEFDKLAINMAIKALEQESILSILDKIRAEIKSLSNANPSYWHSGDMVEREEILDIIDKYKAEIEEE